MSAPSIRQRRQMDAEAGLDRDDQLQQAGATLRLSLTAALLSGKPLERCVEVPVSTGPWSAMTTISDYMGEDVFGDKITSEMLAIIGLLAARKTPDPLADRASAWVDAVAHFHGVRWGEELADQWAALALDAAEA